MATPLLIQVAMTFILLLAGFILRYKAVKNGQLAIGYFRLLEGEAPDYVRRSTRHFSNQFEMPVLFYAAAVLVLALPVASPHIDWLAWTYIIGRLLHSGIHLTYNNVFHRALAFQIANVALAGLWVIIAVHLLTAA